MDPKIIIHPQDPNGFFVATFFRVGLAPRNFLLKVSNTTFFPRRVGVFWSLKKFPQTFGSSKTKEILWTRMLRISPRFPKSWFLFLNLWKWWLVSPTKKNEWSWNIKLGLNDFWKLVAGKITIIPKPELREFRVDKPCESTIWGDQPE